MNLGKWYYDAVLPESISPDQDYELLVELAGSGVVLWADGIEKLTHDSGQSIVDGRLGLRTFKGRSQFDDIVVMPVADYGDAPSPYPTLWSHDGARH